MNKKKRPPRLHAAPSPADRAKGAAAEQAFAAWLDDSVLPHLYVEQSPLTVPAPLRGAIKRPDLGAVTKAAAEGFFCLRVSSEVACDMRDTKAAAAIGELLKREGFEHQWEGRVSLRKENPSGCDVMAFDLLVSW